MISKNIEADRVTFNTVKKVCGERNADVDTVESFLLLLKQLGFTLNKWTYNTMLTICARAKNFEKAEVWLGRMLEAGFEMNVWSYGTMVNVSAQCGHIKRAYYYLEQLD